MNKVIKPKIKKQKRLTSLLGLTLDGSRLEGVVLRRNNDSLQTQQTFSVVLTLDPLTAAPELVGREIRNHLDKNYPYLVVIFDGVGNVAAEIPARNLAEAALDLHGRMADLDRVVRLSRLTPPEQDKPYAVNRRNFKHEQ